MLTIKRVLEEVPNQSVADDLGRSLGPGKVVTPSTVGFPGAAPASQ
jgi:hypothetical protein